MARRQYLRSTEGQISVYMSRHGPAEHWQPDARCRKL